MPIAALFLLHHLRVVADAAQTADVPVDAVNLAVEGQYDGGGYEQGPGQRTERRAPAVQATHRHTGRHEQRPLGREIWREKNLHYFVRNIGTSEIIKSCDADAFCLFRPRAYIAYSALIYCHTFLQPVLRKLLGYGFPLVAAAILLFSDAPTYLAT